MYTSIGAGIPDAVPDSNLQKAVIEGTALDITGTLILFQVGYTAWLILLATAGRKARVVGLPLTALIGLSFLGVIVQLAVPFLPPWPMAGYLLVALATGISFLIKSRR
jgi:CHASE2 domain-containing sensor protein